MNTYDLNGETPYSMVLGIGELFIGFNNGTIRCFDVQSVTHKRTYCKTHYLLCDVAMGRYVDALLSTSHPANGRYGSLLLRDLLSGGCNISARQTMESSFKNRFWANHILLGGEFSIFSCFIVRIGSESLFSEEQAEMSVYSGLIC